MTRHLSDPELAANSSGSARYLRLHVVGNAIHRGCGGLVFEAGKPDFGTPAGTPCGWVEHWECGRCGQELQGADCSIRYTDGAGELEIDVEKYLARGRR